MSEGKGRLCVSPVQARCTLDSRLLVDAGEGGCSVPVASPVSPSPLSSRAPLGGIIVAGRGNCVGLLGEPQARSTSCLLAQCRRVPGMSIAPGGGVCPGASPGQVLPTSPASAPPRPAQRPRPPRWRSRASSRDCRPPQRAGGPGLAPPRTGGGGLGRGCVVVRGTQGGRGPRPLRQCGRSALSACSGSGDILRKPLSKPPRNRKRVQTSAMSHLLRPLHPWPRMKRDVVVLSLIYSSVTAGTSVGIL